MKRSLRLIAVLMVITVSLTGCKTLAQLNTLKNLIYGGASAGDNPAGAFGDENANKVVRDDNIMADLEEVTDEILESISEEQSYDYPLDENFFAWFYGKYGETITRDVANRIKAGEDVGFWSALTGNSLHVLWIY